MSVAHTADLNLTAKDVSSLASADAIAGFLTSLGYDTSARKPLTPEAIGLAGDAAAPIKQIELLSEDPEGFLRVVFVQLRSLTAKSRYDLARVLGKTNVDHLLILTSDFLVLEFVLLDKRRRESRGPVAGQRIQVVPLVVAVARKAPGTKELRTIRRFTWTCRDGLEQFDKLRSVFQAAAFAEDYFCNRALFADHYLLTRLREDAAWRDNPTEPFQTVKMLLRDTRQRWLGKEEEIIRQQLFVPLFELLGFKAKANKAAENDQTQPDYLLTDGAGKQISAEFVYPWDRWLDGPDHGNDQFFPDANPGASVVTALERGDADWIIVTNGRQWRLYSRHAHSRATNFYEVDLLEALIASGDTDPNEAFRYWWLFFRAAAFQPVPGQTTGSWLDAVAAGSRDYAKELGERLKTRIFETIFPHLAQGFLEDRKSRLGSKGKPSDEELAGTFEATLTLLYRLLFLLYAEARDLVPIREAPYYEASLKKLKEEIAAAAGVAESEVADRLRKAFDAKETTLYDRLQALCAAMDRGNPTLNVPTYNGGLFITDPAKANGKSDDREQRIARYLAEHKVPDRYLALAIDRLARDPDDKTLALVPIDYKSLEVRHLGSIYEGLLEFKLKLAVEDLTTQADKKAEKYIPLTAAKPKRGRKTEVVVSKGHVYLSNDKAERKASGSYYTPDPIVEYIISQTVGPVLDEKLEALRDEFRQCRKTFDNEVQKATSFPVKKPGGETWEPREFAAEKTYTAHKDLVERLFEFRVLDPAMGSGHFLVETVDYITDRLLTFLNQFPINPVTFMLQRTRRNILDALAEQGVTVDPDKLTDINLLKRHVLKRCIYGVDLNPMAVELAKVSLWLDAFTLGAPLSFLDHHLRCGNSLIGATFKDLEAATKGQLFRIDYEPLLRAIRHVLFVNTMADATAAEVKQSASEYGQARRDLAGYQIVLDLLVARHFGFPKAAGLLEFGDDLKLESRDALLKSLDNLPPTQKGELPPRALVEQVTELAQQPDRRFFHWEIEFPEVFFAFADANQRHLKHKNEIAASNAGFDCVVGNPPYVRQETIKPLKDFLKASYSTFESTNDLYVYFQEREVLNLRAGGRMAMIVANKWMRAGYGERLRDFLARVAQPLEVIDFGHSPIFPDADTFPCILIAARRAVVSPIESAPSDDEKMSVAQVPREHWSDRMDLGTFVRGRRYSIPAALLSKDGWSLESSEVQTLLNKIRHTGLPLGEFTKRRPLRGILTGLNEAFVIDSRVRDQLLKKHRRSGDIIRPLLRGRDMERWRVRNSETYLIAIPSSENHEWPWSNGKRDAESDFRETYPAIFEHLSSRRAALKNRQDQGRYWWELRSCDYMAAFEAPKLVWQEMAWFTRFSFDRDRHVVLNTAYILETQDPVIPAVLNSHVAWWYMWRTAQHGKDEVLRLIRDYTAGFPVPVIETRSRDAFYDRLESLQENARQRFSIEDAVVEEIVRIADSELSRDCVARSLLIDTESFVSRLLKVVGNSRPSAQLVNRLRTIHEDAWNRLKSILETQLELEQQIGTLVEDAYGLTAEERQLLRATRPIRDPFDVLERRIHGADGGDSDEGESSDGE